MCIGCDNLPIECEDSFGGNKAESFTSRMELHGRSANWWRKMFNQPKSLGIPDLYLFVAIQNGNKRVTDTKIDSNIQHTGNRNRELEYSTTADECRWLRTNPVHKSIVTVFVAAKDDMFDNAYKIKTQCHKPKMT